MEKVTTNDAVLTVSQDVQNLSALIERVTRTSTGLMNLAFDRIQSLENQVCDLRMKIQDLENEKNG